MFLKAASISILCQCFEFDAAVRTLGGFVQTLSTPLSEGTKAITQQANLTVPDEKIDSFSVALFSILVTIVGTRLPGAQLLHVAFPTRFPVDVD